MTDRKSKTLESLQMLLAERGYVVVGLKPGRGERYRVGEILEECCAFKFGQPFQVIAVTDHADWVEQALLIQARLGFAVPRPEEMVKGDSYYRVTTD